MIRNKLAGRFLQGFGALQTLWGIIVLDELHEAQGMRNRIIGSLQSQYGYEFDRAQTDAELVLRRFRPRFNA